MTDLTFKQAREYFEQDKKIISIAGVYFIVAFALSLIRPQLTDGAAHRLRSNFILEYKALPFAEFAFDQGSAYVYPPLFHILGAIAKLITGFQTIVPALMGAGSIFLTYKLVKLWYTRRLGFLSALALAFNPFFLKWSSKIYIGTTITFAFLLTFYLYFLYRDTGSRNYLYSSFFIGGLATMVKTYGPIALMVVGLHIFWKNRYDVKETVMETLGPLVLSGTVSIIWPARNFLLTGSPFPKVYGEPFLSGFNRFGRQVTEPGLLLFVPAIPEVANFLAQMIGFSGGMVSKLSQFHPLLPIIWYLLPLSILGLLAYGALDERENEFIWVWIGLFLLFYEIQRVMSGSGTKFKYRHFVTFTPIVSLFAARAYEKLKVRADLKKIGFLLLAFALIVQMLFSVGVRTQYVDTAYPPVKDYIDQNIAEDEVIYSPLRRNLAVQIDQKVITRSRKSGYINPEKGLESQLRENADWVITSDFGNFATINSELDNMTSLVLVKEIDATERKFYGEIGRNWKIYKMIDPAEDN